MGGGREQSYFGLWVLNAPPPSIRQCSKLRTIMSDLIEPVQYAFLKELYIGEIITLAYDVLDNAKYHDKYGILMSTDFQAAFDYVSWEYLEKSLNQYNFGPDFRNMMKIMYLNSNNLARIHMNVFFF